MKIKIIDNILAPEEYLSIKSVILGSSFPWYITDNILNEETIKCDIKYNYQLTHEFYKSMVPRSEYYGLLAPLLQKIDPFSILRIKSNLNPGLDSHIEYGYHVDYPINTYNNLKTAIYYFTTTNGKTLIKDEENIFEVDCIENRLVIFDSQMEHTGISCTDSKFRCLMNLNYIEKEKVL
jgi:hypothetical protein